MKVLYFHQYFSTPRGAAGNRSFMMARKLLEAGHNVTIVCGMTQRSDTGLRGDFVRGRRVGSVDGIHVVELQLPYSNSDGFIKRTVTFLRFAVSSTWIALRYDYDLVFATTTPLTAGIPAIFAKWLRGKRFIFEVRDLWPELPKAMGVIKNPVVLWAMGILEWVSYRSAHKLIGLSPGIVEGIVRRGVQPTQVMMIPNGCDLDIFTNNVPAWRPAGVGADDLLAVFTGAHGIANGLDAVLDVASVLKSRARNDIKILLIGEGKLKPALQQRAFDQSLDNVIFHDAVPKDKLVGLLAASDIGLQILANVPAFYYGTSPNKFFDYISMGLPVLNNYPGWLAEMIQKYQCGFAVWPDDPDAFAEALIYAAEHPEERKNMGINARKLAESEFSRDQLANDFVNWLESE